MVRNEGFRTSSRCSQTAMHRRSQERLAAQIPHTLRSRGANLKPSPGTRIRGECHWQAQPRERPHWCLSTVWKARATPGPCSAWPSGPSRPGGMPCVWNQRNCAARSRSHRRLYNSGLSGDCRAVLFELIEQIHFEEIFFAGYSMGGTWC